MLTRHKLIVSLALVLLPAFAAASPLVYVLTLASQFGTVDLGTGAFHQIGPDTLEATGGLIPGPNGSLFTLAANGNLDSINPATGVISVIGRTGLADCSSPPASPCGPTSANSLGALGGIIYATDLSNNLYIVNPTTGAATLIGHTGIPAVPAVPTTTNPDGTINIFNETLFGAGGKLYATFDADTFDPSVPAITPVIAPKLYQIDPATGAAKVVDPTALLITAALDLNGTVYAFVGNSEALSHVDTLNLANGHTSFVSNVDAAAGLIFGASPVPVPEPASIALTGIGIAAIVFCRRRRRLCKHASGYLLTLSFALGAISNAFGQGPTFTTIEFPGATLTNAFGINTRGDIVGNYVNADKSEHGFLLSGGQYSTIDFPGDTTTEPLRLTLAGMSGESIY